MNLNTKDISFVNFNNQVINWLKFNGQKVWEAFKNLIVSGVPPLTLLGSVGEPLINYKIEGNATQNGTPTPDAPIEIESVGDKTLNLFDNNINEKMVEKDGDYLILNNYSCNTGIKPSDFLNMTGLKIGDTFTVKRSFTVVKGTGNNVTGAMRFLKSSSGNWQLISGTQSINAVKIPKDFNDTNYTNLYVYGALTKDENGELLTRFKNVQIAKGSYTSSTMPKYEPYGYRIPVKVSGKNLFNFDNLVNTSAVTKNEDGSITVSGYPAGTTKKLGELCPELQVGQTIAFSMLTNGYSQIYLNNLTTGKNIYWSIKNSYVITEDLLGSNIYFYRQTSAQGGGSATISNIQIELGEISTDYEPYFEPTTTNIYLKEPLRKIDEYSDYIDFEKGLVHRKIYNQFFKTVTSTSSENTTYKKFITNISKKPLLKSTNPNSSNAGDMMGYAISNKFQQSKVNYNNLGKYPNLIQTYITTSGGNRVAHTFDDSSITTVAQANEKLGDGFDVCYVLETPIEQTVDLPEIQTGKNTNIVSVNTTIQPSNMEVTYKGK